MRRIHLTALATLLMAEAAAMTAPDITKKSALEGIPENSVIVTGYTHPDSVTDRLAELPLHAIEGMWRFATEGSLMAIERCSETTAGDNEAGVTIYRMVIVRAVDLTLRPGTVMGYLTPTAKRGVYDARIYTGRRMDGTALNSPKTFTLTLNDADSRLAISRYGSTLRFNWWKLLPYMYRHIFTRKDKNPGEINGCIRIFPYPAIPAEPRYL